MENKELMKKVLEQLELNTYTEEKLEKNSRIMEKLFTKEPIIDCKSEEGKTIGLIDSIISISRILNNRLYLSSFSKDIQEALKDLKEDNDLNDILNKKYEQI